MSEILLNKIKEKIFELRAYIISDGGDVEFVSYKDNVLTLNILGACVSCPNIDITFEKGIKCCLLSEFSEIEDVKFLTNGK